MLTISSPDLSAIAPTKPSVGASILRLVGGSDGATIAPSTAPTGALDNEQIDEIPAYEGDEIVIDVGDLGSPEKVVIDGETYTLDTDEELEPGEFSYDPDTGTITIKLKEGRSPLAGTPYRLIYKAASYPPQQLQTFTLNESLPQIFKDWNVNGAISITRSFEQWPTGTFMFTTDASNEAAVKTELRGGVKLDLFGMGFAIASRPQIKRLSKAKHPEGWIEVSVQLRGKWEKFADDPVFLLRGIGAYNYNVSNACNPGSVQLSAIARRVGVPYSGLDPLIWYPPDTPSDATVTLDQEMRSRCRGILGYVHLSDSDAIGIKLWSAPGATGRAIAPADIIGGDDGAIAITCNGDGAIVGGIQLAHEYRNTRLTLEDFNSDSENGDQNLVQEFTEGDPLPNIAPDLEPGLAIGADTQAFRVMSNAFDNGGITKTRKQTKRLNGTPLIEQETIWGFVYTSLDSYEVYRKNPGSLGNPQYDVTYVGINLAQTQWQIISENTTTYKYNDDGYLVGVKRSGFRLVRSKQESDQLEAIQLQVQIQQVGDRIAASTSAETTRQLIAERENLRLQQKLYTEFQRTAVDDVTVYELEDMGKYYPDIKPPQNTEDWVPPKFASRTIRQDRSTILVDDPQSTEESPRPPILSGKDFREATSIQITYPPQGTAESGYNNAKDSYLERKSTANREGSQLKNALVQSYYTENSGRPPIQQRLETSKVNSCATRARDPQVSKQVKHLLNTPSSTFTPFTDPEEGSISFPGIFNIEAARKTAACDISIKNTTDAERWTIAVAPTQRYEEGDRVTIEGRSFVVLSVTEVREIQGTVDGKAIVSTPGWQLELGRYSAPAVTMSTTSLDNITSRGGG